MTKNEGYVATYAEYAKLCYFQHNMANVEYKVM